MFELREPDAGIGQYVAGIELDASGDIIKLAGFPPARRLPLKAEFVSLQRAYSHARANGFDLSRTNAELAYDDGVESIIYRLSQRSRSERGGGRDRVIEVDAHNGRLLRIGWQTWYE